MTKLRKITGKWPQFRLKTLLKKRLVRTHTRITMTKRRKKLWVNSCLKTIQLILLTREAVFSSKASWLTSWCSAPTKDRRPSRICTSKLSRWWQEDMCKMIGPSSFQAWSTISPIVKSQQSSRPFSSALKKLPKSTGTCSARTIFTERWITWSKICHSIW